MLVIFSHFYGEHSLCDNKALRSLLLIYTIKIIPYMTTCLISGAIYALSSFPPAVALLCTLPDRK
ncbi:hypothetical protein CW304_18800 [Bacillus sp. UFRGS-B20]|nr:hypothetical protein CW304_18800 [Bacillus sp. UFRGS-B20]